MSQKKRKIVICGGHLAPALAVIEELKKRGFCKIYFLGRKYAFQKGKFLSLEYQTIKSMGLPFFPVEAPRFGRFFSLKNFLSLFKFPFTLVEQFKLLNRIKPNLILSFGGYIALPVSLAGFFMRIPIITHEQTLRPGLANRIIAVFAKRILVGWRETKEEFRKFSKNLENKVLWVGNPVRKEILNNRKSQQGSNGKTPLPLIYITGGSTGAHSINKAVLEILPSLLEKYRLIHQCGESEYKDYEKLKAKSKKLKTELKKRYSLRKFVKPEEVGEIMRQADIIVSRAGANTITEIALLGKVALLIPLPWAGSGEQLANAKKLEKNGGALILKQEILSSKTLDGYLNTLKQNIQKYEKKAYQFSQTPEIKKHLEASRLIVNLAKYYLLPYHDPNKRIPKN